MAHVNIRGVVIVLHPYPHPEFTQIISYKIPVLF